jgi:hypothetical protein
MSIFFHLDTNSEDALGQEQQQEESATASTANVNMDDDFDFQSEDKELLSTSASSNIFNNFIAPNANESIDVKLDFYKRHPIQPMPKEHAYPFQPSKLYYKVLPNGDRIQRKWLSYSEDLNKLFCASCMVSGSKPVSELSSQPFVYGYQVNVKHVYNYVNIHENSKEHFAATTAAVQCVSGKSIEDSICKTLREKHSAEVENRRKILRRIVDLIIFLGVQGLAFRGKFESAYLFTAAAAKGKNVGNFLALVLLVAKYDTTLRDHVEKCDLVSMKRKMKQGSNRGRGSLVTFFYQNQVSINSL